MTEAAEIAQVDGGPDVDLTRHDRHLDPALATEGGHRSDAIRDIVCLIAMFQAPWTGRILEWGECRELLVDRIAGHPLIAIEATHHLIDRRRFDSQRGGKPQSLTIDRLENSCCSRGLPLTIEAELLAALDGGSVQER